MLLPGQLWKIILAESGYHLKTVRGLISAAKQSVECQRTAIIEELAKHLQTSLQYHRLHRNFDEDLRQRIAHLK